MTQAALISHAEILEQPALWRQLVARYQSELAGCPLWQAEGQSVIGLGEGSSFNAFRLAQYQWQLWLPQVATTCLRPWELAIRLPLDSAARLSDTFWLPISQSGRTASLQAVWQQVQQVVAPSGHPPQGVFLTNTDMPEDQWRGRWCSHDWPLGAGHESAIAATKTFTGSLVALWLLGLYQVRHSGKWDEARLAKVEADILALADQADAWLPTLRRDLSMTVMAMALSSMELYHPAVVLLSNGPLVWGLAEAALKLTETTRQPVLYYHSENFKHGPKAMMSGHPLRLEPPALLYIVPPTEDEADLLYRDAISHEASTTLPIAPKRLWIRFENSPPCPNPAWQQEPTLILPVAHNTRATLLWVTIAFQYLGFLIAETLSLTSDGLQKAVDI